MTQFPDKLFLRALSPDELVALKSDRALYEVVAPFRCTSSFGDCTVPAGFLTDFASIPAAAQAVINDDSPCILFPSVRHDYRYKLGIGERQEADAELREGMIDCGASRLKAALVFYAVRAGGVSHWKS